MLALVVFAVLFLRLWALQVLSGAQYLRAAQNNQLRTVRVQASRGPILDRYGRVLVTVGRRPNQTLERTATRRMFTFQMIKTVSAEAKLADGGGRSSWSR